MKMFLKRLKWIILIGVLFIAGAYVYDMFHEYQEQKRAEENIIKVACVGDSNTYHYGGNDVKELNYSYHLSKLLGDKYKVKNYGMPGTCVQSDLESPYIATRAYKASVDIEADIIIIMLGTNDVWNAGWREENIFYKYYIDLIDSYLQTDNKPEIYLCTIPALFVEDNDLFGYNLQEKVNKVNEIILKISTERDYEIIDVYACTSQNKEWYEDDGIHLNTEAARELSEVIFWSIKEE